MKNLNEETDNMLFQITVEEIDSTIIVKFFIKNNVKRYEAMLKLRYLASYLTTYTEEIIDNYMKIDDDEDDYSKNIRFLN